MNSHRLLLIAILALTSAQFYAADAPSSKENDSVVNTPAFHEKLKEIAATYPSYGRVDDSLRLAPLRCDMPQPGTLKPSAARFSQSSDSATHGQKLYFLFVSSASKYLALSDSATNDRSDPGQIIVKESWSAKEVPATDAKKVIETPAVSGPHTSISDSIRDRWIPYAMKDGKVFHATEKLGLYIMYKLDSKTPDTDDGWVYGTISADGKTVTSAGRVKSCMACHQEAPHGRLFGLKPLDQHK